MAGPSANLHREILRLLHGNRKAKAGLGRRVERIIDYDPLRIHGTDRFPDVVLVTGHRHQLATISASVQRSKDEEELVEDH